MKKTEETKQKAFEIMNNIIRPNNINHINISDSKLVDTIIDSTETVKQQNPHFLNSWVDEVKNAFQNVNQEKPQTLNMINTVTNNLSSNSNGANSDDKSKENKS